MVLSLSCSAVFALFAHCRPVSMDWWMLRAHGGQVSGSQQRIASQLAEEICVICLVVPKLFIFYFTASLKCYLGFTFKWELTLLSISPVSYSHDSMRSEWLLSYCVPDKTKFWRKFSVCNAMLWVISCLIKLGMLDGNETGSQACIRAGSDFCQGGEAGFLPAGETLPAAVCSQATNSWLFSSKLKHTATLQCTIYIYPPLFGWANKFLKTASMNQDPDITLKTPFCHLVVVSLFVFYTCFCFSNLRLLTVPWVVYCFVYCSGRQFFQEGT